MSTDKIEICSIINLTTGKKIEMDYAKFDSTDAFKKKITAKLDTLPVNLPGETDDIQVKWGVKKEGETKYKVKYRAIGGSFSADKKEKKVTIKGLMDVSKINFSFRGVLEVGPKKEEGKENPPAARISVKIGNINQLKEWIIDFSHREGKQEGSYINLRVLLDWIKTKAPEVTGGDDLPKIETSEEDSGAELPIEIVEEDGTKKPAKPEDFIIEFKRMHFNITRKTFHIDVRWLSNDEEIVEDEDEETDETVEAVEIVETTGGPDTGDEEKKKKQITFGNFTISDVALVVTNEPFDYDDKVEEEDDEEEEEEEEEEGGDDGEGEGDDGEGEGEGEEEEEEEEGEPAK